MLSFYASLSEGLNNRPQELKIRALNQAAV